MKEAAKKGEEKASKMVKIVNKDAVQGLKDVKEAIKFNKAGDNR